MSAHPPGRPGVAEWAGLAVVVVVAGVFAAAAWVGPAPFGSDNDEYRMLADALYERGDPVVAGVEGTKYPLGWSLIVGAIDRLGGDDTYAPIVLNVVLAVVTAVVVWAIGRTLAPEAGLVAAGLVATSPAVWATTWSVMPDVALLALTAAGFLLVVRRLPPPDHLPDRMMRIIRAGGGTDDPHDRGAGAAHAHGSAAGLGVAVVAATVVALVAVALKTLGLLLAGALTVALFVRAATRRWSWAPVTAGLALTGLQAWFVAPYPAATTGYGAVFWLREPFDASQGRIGVAGLGARMVERVEVVLREVAAATVGTLSTGLVGWALALLALAVGVAALRRWRWSTLAFVVASLVVLAVWPFASPRFALPLLPVAAVGVGAAIAALRRATAPRPGLAIAALAVLALTLAWVPRAWVQTRANTEAQRQHLAAFQRSTDALAAWVEQELPPGERIASLDYRELAYRVDRPVAPMSYTTDADVLLEQSAGSGADWLVVLRGLTPRRVPPVDALLSAHPERFRPVQTFEHATVYRIAAPGEPAP